MPQPTIDVIEVTTEVDPASLQQAIIEHLALTMAGATRSPRPSNATDGRIRVTVDGTPYHDFVVHALTIDRVHRLQEVVLVHRSPIDQLFEFLVLQHIQPLVQPQQLVKTSALAGTSGNRAFDEEVRRVLGLVVC